MKKKSYIVFGAGNFGRRVAKSLTREGMNVLVVDKDADSIALVADSVTKAVVADVSDENSLAPLGLSSFDGAIVAITGDLAASVMAVVQAKTAGIPYIFAKAKDNTQATVLKQLGATRIVIPEEESAIRLTQALVSSDYLDIICLSDYIEIVEIPAKKEWIGKSLIELKLPSKYNINVIAVRHQGSLYSGWKPDKPIPALSSLVIVGDKKDIAKL